MSTQSIDRNPQVQVETSDGLANLADPEVRYLARLSLATGVPAALVAHEIGVTVDELRHALRRVRSRRQVVR